MSHLAKESVHTQDSRHSSKSKGSNGTKLPRLQQGEGPKKKYYIVRFIGRASPYMYIT